jgi:O-antigen/teichoic acid export membrane protein
VGEPDSHPTKTKLSPSVIPSRFFGLARMSLSTLAATYCPRILRPAYYRLKASPLGARLARGVFWSLAGAVISRGLMLLATIAVARLLGKTVYGELGMIQSTVGMFGILAGFGLGLTATKHIAEFREGDPARAGRILGLSGLIAILFGGLIAMGLWIFAPWLAEHTINAPHLAGALRIGTLILFISALNGAQTGALSGFEAFRAIASVNLLVGLLSFPVLVAGAFWGGLNGAIWALVTSLGFNWIFSHLALRKEAARYNVRITFKDFGHEWAVLWRFSAPAALSGIVSAPVNWFCSAMLVSHPGGYAELGLFSAATQWRSAILLIPTALSTVALPILSSLNSPSEYPRYRRALKYNVLLNLSVAVALALPIALLSPYIMACYGEDFRTGAPALALLSLSSILGSVNAVIGQVVASIGSMWAGCVLNGIWGVSSILIAWLLVGQGATGLAIAVLIAYAIHLLNVFVYTACILSRRPSLGNNYRSC